MNQPTEREEFNESVGQISGQFSEASNLIDDSDIDVRWIVCEERQQNQWRWTEAVRASIDGLGSGLPQHLRVATQPATPDEGLALAMQSIRSGRAKVVVLWSVTPKTFSDQCRRITALQSAALQSAALQSARGPWIQIAATTRIPERYQTVLGEFGVSLQVRQPEGLQRIAKAIAKRFSKEA